MFVFVLFVSMLICFDCCLSENRTRCRWDSDPHQMMIIIMMAVAIVMVPGLRPGTDSNSQQQPALQHSRGEDGYRAQSPVTTIAVLQQ